MAALLHVPTFRLLTHVRNACAAVALLLASSNVAAAPGPAGSSEGDVAPPPCSQAAIGTRSIPLAGALLDGGRRSDA